mmetsp:Transcript_2198/g.5617  ORF Transcript_2198/g.5617 Transcript_2198/m.5617 type:complete len:224 (-) Transcript_2198:326-997(-)
MRAEHDLSHGEPDWLRGVPGLQVSLRRRHRVLRRRDDLRSVLRIRRRRSSLLLLLAPRRGLVCHARGLVLLWETGTAHQPSMLLLRPADHGGLVDGRDDAGTRDRPRRQDATPRRRRHRRRTTVVRHLPQSPRRRRRGRRPRLSPSLPQRVYRRMAAPQVELPPLRSTHRRRGRVKRPPRRRSAGRQATALLEPLSTSAAEPIGIGTTILLQVHVARRRRRQP